MIIDASLAPGDLEGATVFTTLEPCTTRRSPEKTPCAQRLARSGVAVVYVGSYDPKPEINRVGWKTLVDGGVTVRDFDADLRHEIEAMNKDFIDQFRQGRGETGGATFDYEQNGGRFEVLTSLGSFMTRWDLGWARCHPCVRRRGGLSRACQACQPIRAG